MTVAAWIIVTFFNASITYSPPFADESSCQRVLEAVRAQAKGGEERRVGRCIRVELPSSGPTK